MSAVATIGTGLSSGCKKLGTTPVSRAEAISHGVISSKPLHTLRKEFGSQIHARYGLLAASEALRHGGVSVTARHYIENKQRSVLGFGYLLKSEERTVMALVGHDSKAMSAHYTHVGKEALAKAARSLPEI
jgi:integrase